VLPLLCGVLCGVLLGACTNNVRFGGRAGGAAMRTGNTGWLTKKVVSKKPPEALMAEDGTVCRVSPDRFRDTAVGTLLPCNWQ
jgi:hypothetical protein